MNASTRTWQPDRCLPGFEVLELGFPDDYDGAVAATLVRLPPGEAGRGAVLYVHGFADYFFQRHLAERFEPRQQRIRPPGAHAFSRPIPRARAREPKDGSRASAALR